MTPYIHIGLRERHMRHGQRSAITEK